ncbi:MAG: hypothetical protein OXI08_02575 [Cyanobacteria bacterium MAG IRC4_bin_6]|nr:hypothetical protein [Cyanobacteria bacterium MAG IRC4_bin_6]
MAIPAPAALTVLLTGYPLPAALGLTGVLAPALLLQILDAGLPVANAG